MGWGLVIKGAVVAAILFAVWLGYNFITGLIADKETLAVNNAKLNGAVEEQGKAIGALQDNVQDWRDSTVKTNEIAQQAADLAGQAAIEARKVQDVFLKHDLNKIAKAKPVLLERAINRGSDRALRLLECITAPGPDCPSPNGSAANDAANPRPGAASARPPEVVPAP